jgi:hypothetical protein
VQQDAHQLQLELPLQLLQLAALGLGVKAHQRLPGGDRHAGLDVH